MRKTRKGIAVRIVIIIAAALILVAAVGMIVTSVMMADNFSRGDYADPRYIVDYYYEHYQAEYPRAEVEFRSGKNTLKGYIYGEGNDKGLLVFAHGIGEGHEGYLKSLLWFVDNGWRVFTYDATGSGHSEGKGTRGLPQSALDLDAALTFAENDARLNSLPVFVMGHSWGGYAAAAVLNFDHEIAGAASITGYNEPVEMILEWTVDMLGGFRYVMLPFIWTYNKALFGKYSGMTAVNGINRTDVPVLIIHGTEDKTIRYDGAGIISKREAITNPNAEFLTLDGKGHNSMFYTDEALKYIDEVNVSYRALYDSFGGEIPDDARAEFYDGCDKELINMPNVGFLTQIEAFFSENM